MLFTFTKMEGLGNDYLYVYDDPDKYDAPALSIRLSERHFGAGSDGMIWITPSEQADFKMRIFNADGSEAKMCGNGIRCVGKYVYDHGYTDKTHLLIDTLSGIKKLDLIVKDGVAVGATVNMGHVDVSDPKTLDVDGESVTCRPVSVGNPHAVIFVEDGEKAPLTTLGPKVEKHPAFPDGVNTEFVQVIDDHHLRMRVWERGSGVTLACGTGACASTAAAVAEGFCPKNEDVTVTLDGGDLHIKITDDGAAIMTGPATTVYKGEVTL